MGGRWAHLLFSLSTILALDRDHRIYKAYTNHLDDFSELKLAAKLPYDMTSGKH